MQVKAIVLHSVGEGMFWRYDPARSSLFHAYTFDLEVSDEARPHAVLELVWMLGNIDGPEQVPGLVGDLDAYLHGHYARQVDQYRRLRNRSISMGDVVILRHPPEEPLGAFHAVSLGWEPLEGEPPYANDDHKVNTVFDGASERLELVSASYVAHRELSERGEIQWRP